MLTYGDLLPSNGRIGRKKSEFTVIGFPSDLGATTASGQASGVAAIFLASGEDTTGYTATYGAVEPSRRDNSHYVMNEVAGVVRVVVPNTRCVVAIGGDDSITYGVVLGLVDAYPDLAVLHYDAHSDMNDGLLDHSNWVSFVRRLKVPVRQWGQRVMGDTPKAKDQIDQDRPILLAIDMDVIDPAFAPDVAVPYPFGCTPNELIDQIRNDLIVHGRVVGIALTEVTQQHPYTAPSTAHLAAVLLAKVMSLVHTRG